MSKSILKVSVIGSFTLFESKIPLNEQMTLVEHPLNFLIFLTLKSSSRNDKSILHIDQAMPVRILLHVLVHYPRQFFPN